MIPAGPAPFAPAATDAPAPADTPRAQIEEQMALLSRLAQVGMEIAEACGRQATGQEPAEPGCDPALVFARVARAVRMTIALQNRLMKDLAALDRDGAFAERARKQERRMRLSRLVGQAVSARTSPDDARDEPVIEDEIDRLSSDAYERLVDAEDGDLMGGSFDEVVAAICKDLGLSPEWSARVHAAVEPPNPCPPAQRGFDRPKADHGPEGTEEALVERNARDGPLHHAIPHPSSSGGAAKPHRTGDPAAPTVPLAGFPIAAVRLRE